MSAANSNNKPKPPSSSVSEDLNVISKFVAFALAVGALPPAVYFTTKDYLWGGSTILSAISAVVCANLILFGYLFLAWKEESRFQASLENKKEK